MIRLSSHVHWDTVISFKQRAAGPEVLSCESGLCPWDKQGCQQGWETQVTCEGRGIEDNWEASGDMWVALWEELWLTWWTK